jgi:hypothetical protein
MSERVEDGSESKVMWLLVLLPEHTLIELDDHFVPAKNALLASSHHS